MMKTLSLLPALYLVCVTACSPVADEAPSPGASDQTSPQESVGIDDVSEPDDETSSEYEVRPAVPAPLPADGETPEGSCLAEIGEDSARQLVDQCLSISPATRPPCNVINSCDMIRDEIARGCGFGDTSDNPDFCAEYEQQSEGG